MHLWEDHILPEIIDPVTGDQLPPGEVGELVLTTLTKEGIPMLRYRTRDLTSLDYRPAAVAAPTCVSRACRDAATTCSSYAVSTCFRSRLKVSLWKATGFPQLSDYC